MMHTIRCCVDEDNERDLMTHTEANVGEIILKTYDGDVASWYTDFYNDSEHREIMLGDYTQTSKVNGVGEESNYVTTGNFAACVVCEYNGYYYIRAEFE